MSIIFIHMSRKIRCIGLSKQELEETAQMLQDIDIACRPHIQKIIDSYGKSSAIGKLFTRRWITRSTIQDTIRRLQSL